jgi:hypothetical protein
MSRVAQDLLLSWLWRKREILIFLFHLNIFENCWTMFLKHLLHISLNYLLNVSQVSLKFLLISSHVSLKFLSSFSSFLHMQFLTKCIHVMYKLHKWISDIFIFSGFSILWDSLIQLFWLPLRLNYPILQVLFNAI